ncbi:hypothetical protein ACS25C_08425 [Dickeya undicola]
MTEHDCALFPLVLSGYSGHFAAFAKSFAVYANPFPNNTCNNDRACMIMQILLSSTFGCWLSFIQGDFDDKTTTMPLSGDADRAELRNFPKPELGGRHRNDCDKRNLCGNYNLCDNYNLCGNNNQ